MSIKSIDELAAAARHARQLGHMVVLTPDEAEAVVLDVTTVALRAHARAQLPDPHEDTGDVT